MHADCCQDWNYYDRGNLRAFFLYQSLKIVSGIILVTIGGYPNTDIKNAMPSKVIYCPNSNNPTKTFVLLLNSANTLKKFL